MAFRSFTEPAVAPAPHYLTDIFQRALAHWNHERLAPQFPSADWEAGLQRDSRMLRLEGSFLEHLRAEVAEQARSAPTDPDGFIRWFDAGDGELKREGGTARVQVRVMTVHGSKGLQAPIVILADTAIGPDSP